MTKHNLPGKSLRKLAPLALSFLLLYAFIAFPAWATTEIIQYSYDNARQLVKTVYQTGTQLTTGYDNMGNRTMDAISVSGPPTISSPNVPGAADLHVKKRTFFF